MKKEIVLITGGSGMVAQHFGAKFSSKYTVRYLTRKKNKGSHFNWDIEGKYIDEQAFVGVNHIIHLAGSGIADKRWTQKRKDEIVSSRVDSAKLLLVYLQKNNIKLSSFISASAIGFYGLQSSNTIHIENEEALDDFLSSLCHKWEEAAKEVERQEVANRVVILRFGIVLSRTGGALEKMIHPIKYYVGSPIGSGKQYMPWIHIDDAAKLLNFSIDNNIISGTFNAVAPMHITNEEFTLNIAKCLSRPIFFPNVPLFILKLLFGEMAMMLTQGDKISSDKILRSGFDFNFQTIENALEDLIG